MNSMITYTIRSLLEHKKEQGRDSNHFNISLLMGIIILLHGLNKWQMFHLLFGKLLRRKRKSIVIVLGIFQHISISLRNLKSITQLEILQNNLKNNFNISTIATQETFFLNLKRSVTVE